MKDYANPILLLIIIALLSWKVSMGIETPGTVELWLLTLCVTGCIVNGLLAIARALASKKAVMGVVWSMVYLIFCSCSWVTFREEKDYRAEIAIYNELNTKWHSENCNPFSLKDEEGRTLLELAAILGKKTAVRGLLAQPEAQQSADTILRAAFRAAENGHHELIRMIATQPGGFDFNRKCDGSTPLIAAVLSNRRKTTTVLLQFQADPNMSDDNGTTPLMHAVIDNNRYIAKALMEHGASPTMQDRTGRDAFSCSRSEEMDEILTIQPK